MTDGSDGGKTLAVVTMAYNEPDFLPLWANYYVRQVGAENCFVVDHGSDDGSTDDLGRINRLRIPHTPKDEDRRSAFISQFCSLLLKWYDFVAYVDIDEFLVADPAKYRSFIDLCNKTQLEVVTAFGFNLIHRMHHEVAVDVGRPIAPQRQWLYPTSSMAKPLLTRRPIAWPGGFHSWDGPAEFDGLFNFHLAYVDYSLAKRRQAKRRSVVSGPEWKSHHHAASDAVVLQQMEGWSALPTVADVTLGDECRHVQRFINRIRLSQYGREKSPYKIEMNIWGTSLWRVPERFRTCF
jgi:hypothetical protein